LLLYWNVDLKRRHESRGELFRKRKGTNGRGEEEKEGVMGGKCDKSTSYRCMKMS
jgi:hypothetical protein